ncbi:MAG TPA: Mur ligase family protein, partial [Methylibium sp.]
MKHLYGLTVLVLGLGDSGLAMARWSARCGAQVRVADTREQPPQLAALREHLPQASFSGGPFTASLLDGVNLVLKSPGLSPRDPAVAALLDQAAERGLLVQGELTLFARALADLKAERGYAPQLIAITGTNGKTTTTMMAGTLVARAGKRVAVAGNVGPTMLQTLAEALDLEPEAQEQEPSPQPSTEAGEGAEPDRTPSPGTGEGGGEGTTVEAAPPEDEDAVPLQLAPPPPAAPRFEHLPEVWVLE